MRFCHLLVTSPSDCPKNIILIVFHLPSKEGNSKALLVNNILAFFIDCKLKDHSVYLKRMSLTPESFDLTLLLE